MNSAHIRSLQDNENHPLGLTLSTVKICFINVNKNGYWQLLIGLYEAIVPQDRDCQLEDKSYYQTDY